MRTTRTLVGRCTLTLAVLALLGPPAAAGERTRTVTITAEEARARGLWPVGVELQLTDGGLTATRFPQEDVYLTVSGPPGGPLGLRIKKGALHKVTGPFESDRETTWMAKREVTIEVGRRKVKARAFTFGKSLARSHACSVRLDAPAGTAGRLILEFYRGAGTTKHMGCVALASQPPFRELLASLRLLVK